MTFYDDIADTYDDMTGADARQAAAGALADHLQQQFDVHSALDAACGTGVHAVALAQLGIRTVGSDISAAMLRQARRRADAAGVEVRWVEAPMQELADRIEGAFDAVLCLGNSLPHLLADADLDATIAGFARKLAPAGVVILHVLNYARILAERERIIHISRRDQTEYVRFYDFLDDRVRFNILELTWDGDTCRHTLHTTEHRPYRARDLTSALTRHGLSDIRLYGDMQLAAFNEKTSGALVAVAQRPSGGA